MIVLNPAIARAARAYTGLSHIALAKVAGVASRTVYKLEKDGKVTQKSLDKILGGLGRFGVAVLYDDSGLVNGLLFRPKSEATKG